MQIVDFSRSFLTFRVDALKRPPVTVSRPCPFTLNNARIQIDCLCEVQEEATGARQEVVLGASCKTEQVGVPENIFSQPNADFIPVLSRDRFMHFKTFDRANKGVMLHPRSLGIQPERMIVETAKAFDGVHIDVARCEGEGLETVEQIVEATFRNDSLVARTEFEAGGYFVALEYPVKTMNVSERDKIFQTDTGPVLLPEFSNNSSDLMESFALAFVAFNSFGWAEFIVRGPTPIADGLEVYHYCRGVRMNCKNRLFRVKRAA